MYVNTLGTIPSQPNCHLIVVTKICEKTDSFFMIYKAIECQKSRFDEKIPELHTVLPLAMLIKSMFIIRFNMYTICMLFTFCLLFNYILNENNAKCQLGSLYSIHAGHCSEIATQHSNIFWHILYQLYLCTLSLRYDLSYTIVNLAYENECWC